MTLDTSTVADWLWTYCPVRGCRIEAPDDGRLDDAVADHQCTTEGE